MAELKAFVTAATAARGGRPATEPGETSRRRLSIPSWRTVLVSPLLYGMVIPLAVLDLCLEFYHRVGFRLLKIPLVPRRDYIRVDRHQLPYLSAAEKLACAYCGYANGLIQYAARIAGDTEARFCPSRYRARAGFREPPHHAVFAEYGDEGGFRRRLTEARRTTER